MQHTRNSFRGFLIILKEMSVIILSVSNCTTGFAYPLTANVARYLRNHRVGSLKRNSVSIKQTTLQ
jgi:hypothetical protein